MFGEYIEKSQYTDRMQRINIKETDDYNKVRVSVRTYDANGKYEPSTSWDDTLPRQDVERQLEQYGETLMKV